MKPGNNIGVLLLGLFFACSFYGYAQNTGKPLFTDKAPEIQPLNLEVLDTEQSAPLVLFTTQPLLLSYQPKGADYFKNLISKQSNSNYLTPKKPQLEDDVMVKKYFAGEDRSVVRIKSDASLGTFQTKGKNIRIEVRDFQLVDGDRIRVFLNEQIINSNILLNATSYMINVDLQPGYNRIDIQALNQGYSGPNTAELRVYDERGNLISAQEWNIGSGDIATLGIVKSN